MKQSLVLLQTFASDIEAHIAKGVLDTNGIYAVIENEIFSSVFPATLSRIGELRLMVRPEDVDIARELLGIS
jgi:hypothetical protein